MRTQSNDKVSGRASELAKVALDRTVRRLLIGGTMKPEMKTELVRVTYWGCADAAHRHKTEATAASCLAKQKAVQERRKTGLPRKWDRPSYAAVLAQFRAGSRKVDLARQLGLSSSRVGEIISKAERIERSIERGRDTGEPLYELSARTRNCLHSVSMVSVAQIRAALEEGRLNDVPNLGPVSRAEIRLWLNTLPSNAVLSGATDK